MKRIIMTSALALITSCSLYAGADIDPFVQEDMSEARAFNMGLKVDTLGVGLDVSTPINDNLAVRFNLNGFSYSRTEEIDDINYDGDLKLLTAGVLLDYYPFETAFRVSAGAYYNNNKFTGTAKPTGTVDIEVGDNTYGIDDIGQLDTEITFNKFAPYVGLGWGNDARQKGWGFSFDIGAMYHGTPKTDLNVVINNPLLATEINNDVEVEKRNLEDEISKYKFYPVVMIGVNYTF